MNYGQRYELVADKIRDTIDLSRRAGTNPILDLTSLCIEMQAEASREGMLTATTYGEEYTEGWADNNLVILGYIPEPPPTPEPENWKL